MNPLMIAGLLPVSRDLSSAAATQHEVLTAVRERRDAARAATRGQRRTVQH